MLSYLVSGGLVGRSMDLRILTLLEELLYDVGWSQFINL